MLGHAKLSSTAAILLSGDDFITSDIFFNIAKLSANVLPEIDTIYGFDEDVDLDIVSSIVDGEM